MLKFILPVFIIWRVNLEVLAWIGRKLFPLREGFLGSIPWANFDGVHYLSIAKNGYYQFQQAFFPLYPLLIRFLGKLLGDNFVLAGMVISHLSLLGVLILLWKLLEIKEIRETCLAGRQVGGISDVKKWAIVFLLFFPTSFFFGSIYTESLFLFLILLSFYAIRKRKWGMYFLGASLASAVKLVGAFLFLPLGLIAYMIYLKKTVDDSLFFIHAQPAFGAGRSAGKIILLPQVYWRYFKIFTTVSWSNYDYGIALLEFIVFNFALLLLWLGWRRGLPKSWLLFSALAVIGPTLTGSLSSIPRYVLSAFPIFIVMAGFNKKLKYFLFSIFYFLFSILTILFTRGFFVS